MSTYFSEDISKFLNTSQNPIYKLNFFKNSFNYLVNNTLYSQKYLPNLNVSQNIDATNYKLFTSLSKKTTIDNIPMKIGYSPISIQSSYITVNDDMYSSAIQQDLYSIIKKIYDPISIRSLSIDFNIDMYLNLIQQDIYYIHNNIYDIYLKSEKDFNLYQSMSILNNNLPSDYINYLLQYNLNFKPFCYIHNCEPFNLQYNFDTVVVFPFIYEYIFLLKAYEECSNLKDKLSTLIFKDNAYSKRSIKLYFSDYIINNRNDILTKITEYFYKNVFLLGKTISESFINQINTLLIPTFTDLITKFQNSLEVDKLLSDLTVTLIYDLSLQLYSYTSLKYLHENIYNVEDNYFTFTNNFSYFITEEENIKKKIFDWMLENTEYLKSLEIINYKYKLDPLFFINSFYVSHSTIVDTLINNVSNLIDINEYLSKIFITSDNMTNLSDFISTNKIIFNEEIIRYGCIIHFKKLISKFINSEEFLDWLLKTFYPTFIKTLNSIYPINKDDYSYIDTLKFLFNVIFIEDMILNKFAPIYVDNIILDFEDIVNNLTYTPTSINSDFIKLITSIFDNNKFLKEIISTFFRSSFISKYLEGILNPYSIKNL